MNITLRVVSLITSALRTTVTNTARAAHQHRQAFQLLLVLLLLHAGNETACVTCQRLPPVQIIIRGENLRCVFLTPDSAASASTPSEQPGRNSALIGQIMFWGSGTVFGWNQDVLMVESFVIDRPITILKTA